MNPVLRTVDEKVQFFRDILLGTKLHARIIVGHGPKKMEALQIAFDEVDRSPHSANGICIIGDDPDYFMPTKHRGSTIFIYSCVSPSIKDELSESDAESCEIVIFESTEQV